MIASLLVLHIPHIDGFIGKPTIGVVQARNITGMPYSKATDNLIYCVFLCSAVVEENSKFNLIDLFCCLAIFGKILQISVPIVFTDIDRCIIN